MNNIPKVFKTEDEACVWYYGVSGKYLSPVLRRNLRRWIDSYVQEALDYEGDVVYLMAWKLEKLQLPAYYDADGGKLAVHKAQPKITLDYNPWLQKPSGSTKTVSTCKVSPQKMKRQKWLGMQKGVDGRTR